MYPGVSKWKHLKVAKPEMQHYCGAKIKMKECIIFVDCRLVAKKEDVIVIDDTEGTGLVDWREIACEICDIMATCHLHLYMI